jgi:hypothetical protein
MRGIPLLAQNRLAYQEGLCCMEQAKVQQVGLYSLVLIYRIAGAWKIDCLTVIL